MKRYHPGRPKFGADHAPLTWSANATRLTKKIMNKKRTTPVVAISRACKIKYHRGRIFAWPLFIASKIFSSTLSIEFLEHRFAPLQTYPHRGDGNAQNIRDRLIIHLFKIIQHQWLFVF